MFVLCSQIANLFILFLSFRGKKRVGGKRLVDNALTDMSDDNLACLASFCTLETAESVTEEFEDDNCEVAKPSTQQLFCDPREEKEGGKACWEQRKGKGGHGGGKDLSFGQFECAKKADADTGEMKNFVTFKKSSDRRCDGEVDSSETRYSNMDIINN